MNTPGSVLYGWAAYIGAGVVAFYLARQDLLARRKRAAEERLAQQAEATGTGGSAASGAFSGPRAQPHSQSHIQPHSQPPMDFTERLKYMEAQERARAEETDRR